MGNRILILLMSCGDPLYEEEERVCRETFLENVPEGVEWYFYKGTGQEHPCSGIDEETHTVWVDAPDTLNGTAEKTLRAIRAVLDDGKEFDYLLKTNVSTYICMDRLMEVMSRVAEPERDFNIYGARFIVNSASLNVPFPRGHFILVSRTLLEGSMPRAVSFLETGTLPRTDDTLLSLALLYHISRDLGLKYLELLREVPAINDYDHAAECPLPTLPVSVAIRCKHHSDNRLTPDAMRALHKRIVSPVQETSFPCPLFFETPYGFQTYNRYLKYDKLFKKFADHKKWVPAPEEGENEKSGQEPARAPEGAEQD